MSRASTPSCGEPHSPKPRSLGLHESQSRLWENWVGAEPALSGAAAAAPARALPGQLRRGRRARSSTARANRVERSLIRIEADEVTYNLHILIRFELELEIFEGGLELTDLPEAWNARYRDYLGLDVPDDAHGVLQDVHWPSGAFGYFPTYSLGNIIAGQLWEAAGRDLGDLRRADRRGRSGLARRMAARARPPARPPALPRRDSGARRLRRALGRAPAGAPARAGRLGRSGIEGGAEASIRKLRVC